MIHIKGKVITDKLVITDSFVDFTLFTIHPKKAVVLNRAAIIPIQDYSRLLQIAEDYEQLKLLQPLVEALDQREIESMEDACHDDKLLKDDKKIENCLGDPDNGTDK